MSVCMYVCQYGSHSVCSSVWFVYPFVHFSICLTDHQFVYLSAHLFVCVSVCSSGWSIYLFVNLSTCLSGQPISLPMCLFFYLSANLFVCVSHNLSAWSDYLFVHMSLYLSDHQTVRLYVCLSGHVCVLSIGLFICLSA
jgi:hypothetical protein